MEFTEKLGKSFVITTELGPVKGGQTLDSLDKARDYLPLDAINVHDCPMGNLRINPISLSVLIHEHLQVAAIPHFTCRDRSLLGTQADLLGAHALGIRTSDRWKTTAPPASISSATFLKMYIPTSTASI